MKKINTRSVAVFILVIVISAGCKKQDSKQYPDHIVAGRSIGAEILYSGPLGIDIFYPGPGQSINESWGIDLNRDGTDDYMLKYKSHSGHGFAEFVVQIESLDPTNNHIAVDSNHGNWVDTIPNGAKINDSLRWYHAFGATVTYDYYADIETPPTTKGLWKGVKNRYIGVRFKSGENQIYGWIRIETDGPTFKFFDYACTTGY